MVEKILAVMPYVLISISSVAMAISTFINYLSCDSCKVKRQAKLEKLKLKLSEKLKEIKNNE